MAEISPRLLVGFMRSVAVLALPADAQVSWLRQLMEALRALKRRLSDVVYRQMTADAKPAGTGPGGHTGATLQSSAADPNPKSGTSEKLLPGPAEPQPKTPLHAEH